MPSITEQTVEIKNGVAVTIKFEFISQGILQVYSLDTSETALSGMKLKVTKINGEMVGEFTTDVTGVAKIPGLTPGWYVVTCVKPPEDYSISGELAQNVEITSNGDAILKFYFAKQYGVQIRTYVNQTSVMLPGVKYQITKLDGAVVGSYTSDAAGLIYVSLAPGWYVE